MSNSSRILTSSLVVGRSFRVCLSRRTTGFAGHPTIYWRTFSLTTILICAALLSNNKVMVFYLFLLILLGDEPEKSQNFLACFSEESYAQLLIRVAVGIFLILILILFMYLFLLGKPLAQSIYALEGDHCMIFLASDLVTYACDQLALASGLDNLPFLSEDHLVGLRAVYSKEVDIKKALRNVAIPANSYLQAQLQKHANSWYEFIISFGSCSCYVFSCLTNRLAIRMAAAFCPWHAGEVEMIAAIQFFKTRGWLTTEEAMHCEQEVKTFVAEATGTIVSSFLFLIPQERRNPA